MVQRVSLNEGGTAKLLTRIIVDASLLESEFPWYYIHTVVASYYKPSYSFQL